MGSGTGGGGGNFWEHPLAFTEPLFGPIGDFFSGPDIPDAPKPGDPPRPKVDETAAARARSRRSRNNADGQKRRSTVLTNPNREGTALGSPSTSANSMLGA